MNKQEDGDNTLKLRTDAGDIEIGENNITRFDIRRFNPSNNLLKKRRPRLYPGLYPNI